jgi:hypothetical protein
LAGVAVPGGAPYQNSTMAMGCRPRWAAACSSLGAQQSPVPAGERAGGGQVGCVLGWCPSLGQSGHPAGCLSRISCTAQCGTGLPPACPLAAGRPAQPCRRGLAGRAVHPPQPPSPRRSHACKAHCTFGVCPGT